MKTSDIFAIAGVSLLLLAFALNLAGKVHNKSISYLVLNVIGGGLAGVSSYLIEFWPFVVLQTVWTVTSLVMLINSIRNPKSHEFT